MTDLNFDSISLIRVPFKLKGEDYYLQEADGETGCEYRDAKASGMKADIDENGKVVSNSFSMQGAHKAELILLSRCLFKGNHENGNGERVLHDIIKQWPDRVLQPLVEKVKEISELDAPRENPTRRSEQSTTATG